MTEKNNLWMYASDMAPQATIINTTTAETRQIVSVGVKDRAPVGLRRYLLEEQAGGQYIETGDVVPMSVDIYDDLEEFHRCSNSWIYDWPHLQVEQEGDAEEEMREKVASRLTAMMAQYPYEFELVGLQRRYLMYLSDGNKNSQASFERMIPAPVSSPFKRNGGLKRRYDFIWNSIMRDAKVPYPSDKEKQYGQLRPCMYAGPAWVVRFLLDGQDVLLDRCRVYVDDEANFLCSDWCQRHDHSSYSAGINLQMGIYSFDAWVTGPCLVRNKEAGSFKPKTAKVERHQVRTLMKGNPVVVVPDFDTVHEKATALLAKAKAAAPKSAEPEKPAVPDVDAGPITADAMADAMKVAKKIWKSANVAGPDIESLRQSSQVKLAEDVLVHNGWTLVPAKYLPQADGGYVAMKPLQGSNGHDYVGAVWYTTNNVGKVKNLIDDIDENESQDGFMIDTDGLWYADWGSYGPGEDELQNSWWMYDAAVYYRDHLKHLATV